MQMPMHRPRKRMVATAHASPCAPATTTSALPPPPPTHLDLLGVVVHDDGLLEHLLSKVPLVLALRGSAIARRGRAVSLVQGQGSSRCGMAA